jgi:transposase IS166 family protein
VTTASENLPDDIAALKAALAAERIARQEAEARASNAEALVAHYKLLIAKLKREQHGQSSERGRKPLDQLELQLEEAASSAAEGLGVTLSWLRKWPAFRGGMTVPDQELARWWAPRDFCAA